MIVMKYIHLLSCSALLAVAFVALGCGSNAPVELDAAGEVALRAEMAKVEAAEQEHFRQATQQQAPQANRQQEGENVGERSF